MALIEHQDDKEWVVSIVTLDGNSYVVAAGVYSEEAAKEVSRGAKRAYLKGLRDAREAISLKMEELDF